MSGWGSVLSSTYYTIHMAVQYRLAGYEGPTSHNNEQRIAEVNRICPLIGLRGVEAGRQVAKRATIKGKSGSVVKKADEGNVPFKARLLALARSRMGSKLKRRIDPEDVV